MSVPEMDIRSFFCATCGHRVRLTSVPGPELHGQANLPDGGEVVCLDYEEGCTGDSCFLTGRPGAVMAVRLARSHLDDGRWPRIQGVCPACGSEGELERLDARLVFCELCQTASLLPEG